MKLHNNYMENLKKSKDVVLELLEDTKDLFDGIFIDMSPPYGGTVINKKEKNDTPNSDESPCTSKQANKKATEFVKYGKITFDTTAILHHYPQRSSDNTHCIENPSKVTKVAMKKTDLNLPLDEIRLENNNDIKSENKQIKINVSKNKDNFANNNEKMKSIEDNNTISIFANPIKFTEEKLV